ncbi:integrase catalytic domain-containing protein [Trichonephila inaurata madagascariensis]|uniref:Integrase catalytic domain-containing protein n=1 Tax=Trichonephila inaurata madagascariensis TaxID=2747483 RepID=A0A8X7BSU3_9ARAC|nr:integrase catalytic domain-containing protein [Trichonephila inaurata madagascariensis]
MCQISFGPIELNTILCDAEAVINSRPLNYLSEDPDYLKPLTPSMFLQDIQMLGVPDLGNIDNINLTKRLRCLQRLRNDLRNRFRDEYLSLLSYQEIKKAGSKEVRVGDVVLISCDNKKRLDWPMGLVMEVFPGKDNSIRVVKVKTPLGELVLSGELFFLSFHTLGDITKCLLREELFQEEEDQDKIKVPNNLGNKDNPRGEEDLQDKLKAFSYQNNRNKSRVSTFVTFLSLRTE